MKQITPQNRPSVKLFSIEQVRDCLGVSRPTVNRLIVSNALHVVKIGRSIRIPESSLLEFIEHGGGQLKTEAPAN